MRFSPHLPSSLNHFLYHTCWYLALTWELSICLVFAAKSQRWHLWSLAPRCTEFWCVVRHRLVMKRPSHSSHQYWSLFRWSNAMCFLKVNIKSLFHWEQLINKIEIEIIEKSHFVIYCWTETIKKFQIFNKVEISLYLWKL